MKKMCKITIAAFIIAVCVVALAWRLSNVSSTVDTRAFVAESSDFVLARDFGPVTDSTPDTHFQILNITISYHSDSVSHTTGEITYEQGTATYHVIIVMRGYFAEQNYSYGTDYIELCPN